MKTASEIRDEVKALREIKPLVPHYTLFMDDNWQAIDRQIEALIDEWDMADVDDLYDGGDLTGHDYSYVCQALEWALGEYESFESDDGILIDRPSRDWSSLAGVL